MSTYESPEVKNAKEASPSGLMNAKDGFTALGFAMLLGAITGGATWAASDEGSELFGSFIGVLIAFLGLAGKGAHGLYANYQEKRRPRPPQSIGIHPGYDPNDYPSSRPPHQQPRHPDVPRSGP